MSQHFDISKTVAAKAIEKNWSKKETFEFYSDILGDLEYPDDFCEPDMLIGTIKYMLTQHDGLYGVSHEQIKEWLIKPE